MYTAILSTPRGFRSTIAIHTIIQTLTGVFVFSVTRHDTEAQLISYLDSSAPGIHRAESFLTNADSNGTFLAMLLFIPLGLFLESSSLLLKVLYLAETFLMLPALLFTYSTGAMLAALGGLIVFLLLAGRAKYLVQISMFLS